MYLKLYYTHICHKDAAILSRAPEHREAVDHRKVSLPCFDHEADVRKHFQKAHYKAGTPDHTVDPEKYVDGPSIGNRE